MKGPSGWWWIDGFDLWDNFGLMIEKGTADFLKVPPRKDTNQHDWPDQNGLDIDTTQFFFKERTITLNCAMIADSESQFWLNRKALLTLITQPGTRRLVIAAHGTMQYYIIYKDSTTPQAFKPLSGSNIVINDSLKVAYRFNITIVEPDPDNRDGSNIMQFLAADDGKLIVT